MSTVPVMPENSPSGSGNPSSEVCCGVSVSCPPFTPGCTPISAMPPMSARSRPAGASGRTERTSVMPAIGEPSAGLPSAAAAASWSALSVAVPSADSARIPPSTCETE